MKSRFHEVLAACAALLALAGAARPGAVPPDLAGLDMGTAYVRPAIYLIGPIKDCGRVRLPEAENSKAVYGCPASVLVVPGHYEPVPRENWRLTGSTRLLCEAHDYECVISIFLGFIPIPVSYECIRNSEIRRGPSFVVSWEAEPYAHREPIDPVPTGRN